MKFSISELKRKQQNVIETASVDMRNSQILYVWIFFIT